MRGIKMMISVLAAMTLTISCGKDKPVVEYLDVTPNNISGEWKLVEWNGSSLNEGTYVYIEFVRKDKEFVIYQNVDSMGDMPHVVTGSFNIDLSDVEAGPVIQGMYDYDGGIWAYDYEVNELTEDSMTWVAVGNDAYVQKWVRTSIPETMKGE